MKTVLKPKTEWGSWKEEAVVAQKRTTTPMKGGKYESRELTAPAVRIGADDHMKHPSRTNNILRYRDGTTKPV